MARRARNRRETSRARVKRNLQAAMDTTGRRLRDELLDRSIADNAGGEGRCSAAALFSADRQPDRRWWAIWGPMLTMP